MSREPQTDWVIATAREKGPIPEGCLRVLVLEPDLSIKVHEFASLEDAIRYADDAASEVEGPSPLAWILDSSFRIVDRGRHYSQRRE